MITGSTGTFVIRWKQTEIDGMEAPKMSSVCIGAAWRWSGSALRVDGPDQVILTADPTEMFQMRQRTSRSLRRVLSGHLRIAVPRAPLDDDAPLFDKGFVLTDGRDSFSAAFVERGGGEEPLVMFTGRLPPADTDLWVVQLLGDDAPVRRTADFSTGVICFTSGTMIATPEGPRPVERIREGDWLLTRDNGPQQVVWRGSRWMSGARFYAMPEFRPVRIREGALDSHHPNADLLVSPLHRILVKGARARALFNTDEVLVAAEMLINDRDIMVDYAVAEVTYHHLMLSEHQIVWANNVECESFHPANTALDALAEDARDRLLELYPELGDDPFSYGETARRDLSRPEAAILRHAMG